MDNLISSFDIAIIIKKEMLFLENVELQLQKGTILMGNDGKGLLLQSKAISFSTEAVLQLDVMCASYDL